MARHWPLLLLGVLGLASACSPPPLRAARAPLPACEPARSQREAQPPAANPRTALILLAVQEWIWFGAQEVDYTQSPAVVRQRGLREDGGNDGSRRGEAPLRVAAYWRAAGHEGRSGVDGIPWSAAFISWLFVNAAVPASEFCPSQRHAIYVERIVESGQRPQAWLVARRPGEHSPQPGDLVCAAREASGLSLDNLNRGAGHCDLVVERRADAVLAIGGNVVDSVSRSIFPLDPQGRLVAVSARPFFAVIQNRLPPSE